MYEVILSLVKSVVFIEKEKKKKEKKGIAIFSSEAKEMQWTIQLSTEVKGKECSCATN